MCLGFVQLLETIKEIEPPINIGWLRAWYGAKFSRRIIFAFFADWSGTTKIRRREKVYVKGMANKISLICENCFRETLQITQSEKIVHLENLALYGIHVHV